MRLTTSIPLVILAPLGMLAAQRPPSTATPAAASVADTAPPTVIDTAFRSATVAWDGGDYPAALRAFTRLLDGANGERYLERIALITGELFHTTELAPDGRELRVSPSGRFAAFETGSGAGRRTYLARLDPPAVVDSFRGHGLAFAGDGRVVFLRTADTDAVRAARAALAPFVSAQDREGAMAQQRKIAAAEGAATTIIVRDLASREEREIADPRLQKTSLTVAPDGRTAYFVAKREGEPGTSIYAIPLPSGVPTPVTVGNAVKADPVVLPGGEALVYSTGGRDPFGLPIPGAQSSREPGIVIRDIASGVERSIDGFAPSLSEDGASLVYLSRRGAETTINVAPTRGGAPPVVVKRTTDRVDAPTLSPDGRTVVYQAMPREDWELFAIGTDGAGERRLTREIQHDLFPRYIDATTLLSVMGEGRHRRSYLYDVPSGRRTRLFHNNTIRTIAPEYEWAVTPDGTRGLIAADRDGNTVSPERGVYVVDLTRKVTKDELLARLRTNLAAETKLREETQQLFAPIADQVRAATERVSIDRLYGYAHDLFLFDSKHINQPGNAKAIEYLRAAYTSFGYQPELQWFQPRGRRSANVVASLRGTVSPDVVYVVGSHFDSVEGGPGADDNTSGTSMLLETARVLAKTPLPATVLFVSFTGEEAGLLGSREFVRRLVADSVGLAGVMNNDMMGWSNDQRLDNTIRYSNPGIRDVQHGAALHFSKLITYDALYYRSTDAAAFYEQYGDIVGGFGSYPVLGNPHYHQRHDVLETINHELVTETTRANVATIMYLASSPSRLVGLEAAARGNTATVSWTPSAEKDVREYVVSYGPASDPLRRTVRVREPSARLTDAPAGTHVAVRAVNARGLAGWDWARTVVK